MDEQDDCARTPIRGWPRALTLSGLLIISFLPGCGNGGTDVGSYPSLRTVPAEPRPNLPIEERRKIVRDLIEERDQSRRQTVIVRGRSGLSTQELPLSAGTDVTPEDIIPDVPADGGKFGLTPDEGVGADSVYRRGAQIDDGGLDDFIRQLKRDTNPSAPSTDGSDEPLPEASDVPEPSEDEKTSSLLQERSDRLGHGTDTDLPIVLAAFAPAIISETALPRDVRLRLAASDEDSGFFCSYFGWTVGWSSVCVDETETDQPPPAEGEGDVGADVGEEAWRPEEQQDAENEPLSRRASPDQAARESTEPRLSGEDARRAIEDFGSDTLAPFKGSLAKLREFMQARRSGGSSDERSPYRRGTDTSSGNASLDLPPVPHARPRQREDITIVDGGELFEFRRTPAPAFKPSIPDEQTSGSRTDNPPARPLARPNDLVAGGDLEQRLREAAAGVEELEKTTLALAEAVERERAADDQPFGDAALSPAETGSYAASLEKQARAVVPEAKALDEKQRSLTIEAPEVDSIKNADQPSTILIFFEPGASDVPGDVMPRLANILADAEARGQKIHIIGEAGTNHLALRRATDIGAAFVRLEATAEILEYDFKVIPGVDQVRLLVQPPAPGRSLTSAEPSASRP